MFVVWPVGASFLSLLQAVVARCGLPYAALVSEVAGDGAPVYGVEVQIPSPGWEAPVLPQPAGFPRCLDSLTAYRSSSPEVQRKWLHSSASFAWIDSSLPSKSTARMANRYLQGLSVMRVDATTTAAEAPLSNAVAALDIKPPNPTIADVHLVIQKNFGDRTIDWNTELTIDINGFPPHTFHPNALASLLQRRCNIQDHAFSESTGACQVGAFAANANSIPTSGEVPPSMASQTVFPVTMTAYNYSEDPPFPMSQSRSNENRSASNDVALPMDSAEEAGCNREMYDEAKEWQMRGDPMHALQAESTMALQPTASHLPPPTLLMTASTSLIPQCKVTSQYIYAFLTSRCSEAPWTCIGQRHFCLHQWFRQNIIPATRLFIRLQPPIRPKPPPALGLLP